MQNKKEKTPERIDKSLQHSYRDYNLYEPYQKPKTNYSI